MTTKYFALLTNQGAAKLANAAALGTKVNITQLAVGDGGGTLPTPDPAQTKLIGEKRRASLNSLTIDAANGSQIIAEQIIPEGEGGFWIREIGLFDADGVMIAVANCAETYKPQLAEGSGRTQTVRMIIIVNSTSAVTLKIDPSVVLATRKYVDDGVIVAKQYADNLQKQAKQYAEQLQAEAKQYADTLLEQAKKYSGDALKQHTDAANPHTQYPLTKNALKEMADAGLVAEALKNLGLEKSFVAIGYVKLPGGLIIQWGSGTYTKQAMTTVTLPIEFPNAGFVAVANKGSSINLAGEYSVGIQLRNKSTIDITNTAAAGSTTQGIFWLVVGY
ncbi:phage tail protein [Pantoea sp. SOD02]|uniref:phage tail protein n=1 Tax=Pantoea sp. SOD02 TaxID=2970818 RepID=UPI0021581AD6|nr:phage tail protein [Pantoea sp. SOD02]UVC28818.1 phage tail protein [Pantoea sp. SOD02]